MTTWPGIVLAAHLALARDRAELPQAVAEPRVPAQAVRARALLRGTATWYGTGPGAGEAAAGSELRRALGRHWRGTIVRVCATRCVRVRLSDWCGCPGPRVVDLAVADFRRLAPLSRGVVRVRVVLP